MKNIFNNVDTKYLDCISGTCEHITHGYNGILVTVLLMIVASITTYRYLYTR